MNLRHLLSLSCYCLLPLWMQAQSIPMLPAEQLRLAQEQPETMGSIFRAYPTTIYPVYTPVPRGYQPVFLTHYGRHGSRFQEEDARYTSLLEYLAAHELTAEGKELYRRIHIAYLQAKGRGGDLTSLGEQQHREIAQRMYAHHPSLFAEGTRLKVYSSTKRRCLMSMMAFCEALKEQEPTLRMERDVCDAYMPLLTAEIPDSLHPLKQDTPARQAYEHYRAQHFAPQRFLARIFAHPEQVEGVLPFMERFYLVAQGMQDCGRPADLLSYFDPATLYAQWRIKNCEMYLANGDSPLSQGAAYKGADALLQSLISDADQALQEKRGGATLRFGHDTALLRLLTRMKIRECCPQVSDMERLSLLWQDYHNAPMAANLQVVFYQNKKGHTLVRFLLNEKEVHLALPSPQEPYYDWEAVKAHWQ